MDNVEETDKLDDILDVAVEVLRDYGEEALTSQTRVCRLARYLIARLGGPPYKHDAQGETCRVVLRDGRAVWRAGDVVRLGTEAYAEWPLTGISGQATEEILVAITRAIELEPTDN